jgi:hypothetical protein
MGRRLAAPFLAVILALPVCAESVLEVRLGSGEVLAQSVKACFSSIRQASAAPRFVVDYSLSLFQPAGIQPLGLFYQRPPIWPLCWCWPF